MTGRYVDSNVAAGKQLTVRAIKIQSGRSHFNAVRSIFNRNIPGVVASLCEVDIQRNLAAEIVISNQRCFVIELAGSRHLISRWQVDGKIARCTRRRNQIGLLDVHTFQTVEAIGDRINLAVRVRWITHQIVARCIDEIAILIRHK